MYTAYLFGIYSLRLTQEWIESRLFMLLKWEKQRYEKQKIKQKQKQKNNKREKMSSITNANVFPACAIMLVVCPTIFTWTKSNKLYTYQIECAQIDSRFNPKQNGLTISLRQLKASINKILFGLLLKTYRFIKNCFCYLLVS